MSLKNNNDGDKSVRNAWQLKFNVLIGQSPIKFVNKNPPLSSNAININSLCLFSICHIQFCLLKNPLNVKQPIKIVSIQCLAHHITSHTLPQKLILVLLLLGFQSFHLFFVLIFLLAY
jgi:hypothetical protein